MRAAYSRVLRYLLALGLTALSAAVFYAIRGVLDTTLVALLLLIPVGVSTAAWGLGPGIASALFAFLSVNFLFIQPYYTLTVHRPGDLVILLVFLVVAVVMSQLVARAQAGLDAATAREREATQMYELSTALAGLHDDQTIARNLAEQLMTAMTCDSVEISLASSKAAGLRLPSESRAADRQADLVVPIRTVKGLLGEIRLWRSGRSFSLAETRLAGTYASQGALALDRAALAQAESRAKLLEESDRLKSSLLSSVSHDLRTPLATIKAAASSLRSGEIEWETPARAELVAAIDDEADHLNMLVGNLLDMSRIESGALRPQRKWHALSEIVEKVRLRMQHMAENHQLVVEVPEDLPPVPVDFVQLEQVFTNLISNSIKFAPPGTVVRVSAQPRDRSSMGVQVSNQGPPVPAEHLQGIFDKFYRVTAADRVTGTGLGLSICKAIIEAHGGAIWAENLTPGFAFNFTLPLQMEGSPSPRPPAEAGSR